MSKKSEKLLEEALSLTPEERAEVAASLLDSLDEQEDEAVEAAWATEIEKRIREVESGQVRTVPWSEVRRRLRKTTNGPTRS